MRKEGKIEWKSIHYGARHRRRKKFFRQRELGERRAGGGSPSLIGLSVQRERRLTPLPSDIGTNRAFFFPFWQYRLYKRLSITLPGGIPRKWRGILLFGPLFSSLCVCFLQTCLIWSEKGFFCGSRTNKRTRGDNSGQTLSPFFLSPCVFLSTIQFVVSNELPFGQTNNNGGAAAAVARTFVVAAQTDIFGPFQCTRERPIA